MDYPTLEQTGILLNMVAGALMGLEFFVGPKRIKLLNDYCENLLRPIKHMDYNALDEVYIGYIGDMSVGEMLAKKRKQRIVGLKNLSAFVALVLFVNALLFSGVLPSGVPHGFELYSVILWDILFSILMIIFFIMFFLPPMLLKILTISPRGTVGSVGVGFFIIGNFLQLLATTSH